MALVWAPANPKDLKRCSFPRISLDPSHNNTIGWKLDSDLEDLSYFIEPSDKGLVKYRKMFTPCFLFWRRQKKHSNSENDETPRVSLVYEFGCQSTILNSIQVQAIEKALPSSSMSLPWTLTFSSQSNGFSLNTLYRRLGTIDSPVLLVIEDTERRIFGAYSSSTLEQSQTFYGTNQCFLFTLHPSFKAFKATGSNHFFVLGTPDSITFGSDDGTPGLWIDSDLYRGRSDKCCTFGNAPLVPETSFVVRCLECWTFG